MPGRVIIVKHSFPLSFQVAHAHSRSSVYHLTVSLFTQSSNKLTPSSFRDLPAGTTFVGWCHAEFSLVAIAHPCSK